LLVDETWDQSRNASYVMTLMSQIANHISTKQTCYHHWSRTFRWL